jgi:hypothetical protein
MNREKAHSMLLRLAARVPDDGLAMMRDHLAAGRQNEVAKMLGIALNTGRLALLEHEEKTVRELVGRRAPMRVPRLESLAMPPFLFIPDEEGAELDEPLVEACREISGLRAVWRVTRWVGELAGPLVLGETDAGVSKPPVTARLQRVFEDAGEIPRVEIFGEDEVLPPYHESALITSRLLWYPEGMHDVHVAKHVTADGDRPSEEDRARLSAFLNSGVVLLAALSPAEDRIDPENGAPVPAGFRTDGTWVWAEADAHYLDRYGIGPDPDLVQHALSGARPRMPLSRVDIHRLLTALGVPA